MNLLCTIIVLSMMNSHSSEAVAELNKPLESTTVQSVLIAASSPEPMRGIYMTASTVAGARNDELTTGLLKAAGNTVVFDVQSGSRLAYPSTVPLSVELGNVGKMIPDMKAAVQKMHDQNLTVVGRLVLFKNEFLPKVKPQWSLTDKRTGKPFNAQGGVMWLDSGNPELIAYYKDVVNELADFGFDEIQFDYVRFPEAGKGGAINYHYTNDATISREDTIVNAVTTLATALHEKHVKVGIDVFGIIVWDSVSPKLIGQNITLLAPHVDAIYPMPYPSHFGPGWGGHENPGDEPYFFVYETTKKFIEQTAGSGAMIRPWLQGFAYRTKNFDANYVQEQIRALKNLGINQYIVWNASNNYPYTFTAFKRTAPRAD